MKLVYSEFPGICRIMAASTLVEIVCLIINTCLFSGYHAYLFWGIWKNPSKTAAGQNDIARRSWCRLIMEHGKDILAVQTLRNSMMSSSLLATTALTLSSIIAAFFIKEEGISRMEELSDDWSDLFSIEHKLFVMILLFMLSFFAFMQSVRLVSHAGYMICVPPSGSFITAEKFVTPEYVANLLFRSSIYHTIGTRLFYAAFLTVLWLFGPISASVALLLLLFCLYWADFNSIQDKDQ